MDELKTNAQALLERAKPGFAPSSDELERLRRRLSSEPTPPPDDAGPPPAKAANWAWYAGAVVIAGLLAAGAAVVASGQGDAVVEAAPRPAPTIAAPAPTKAAAVPVLSPAPSSSAAVVAPSLAPAPDPADSPSTTTDRTTTPKRTAPRRAAAPSATDTFAAELELITAARKALEARTFTTARTTAQRYLRRFEDGSFGEEAEVLRLLASCGIERSEEVKARARAYARSHDSAFARRVRLACLDDPH